MSRAICIGDEIVDNDPRTDGRKRTVGSFDRNGTHVWARGWRIRIDRIHADGKPRRSSFTLVCTNGPETSTSSTT